MPKTLKFASVLIFLALFIITTGFNHADPAFQLTGVWESEEKNLQIEMFEENDQFAGKMIYFKCSSDDVMRTSKDTENPDRDLRDRNLLGLKLVTQLDYQGEGIWDDGEIYDPNSGNTFEARIQLTGPNTAIVRGYWKYRWIGRSMVFHRK
jgi:uncharacterized protein (DUF2147 family)